MSEVGAGLSLVRERIAAACARAKRPIEAVTLVAVSKLQPTALIREAYDAGQRDFGENYAQELRDKAAELAGLDGLRWHGIGPLQTNKAKYVAQVAYAFHAVDRVEIAQELAKRRKGEKLRCYLEVNVGGETTKSGVRPEDAPALLTAVRAIPSVEVVGLMTLPPPGDDPRPHFASLRTLATKLHLRELSMGTTADYELAIEEGATLIRVGTAIFGARPARTAR